MLGKITLSSFLYNPGLVLDCERIFGRRPKVKLDDSLIPLSETLAQIAIIGCFEHYKDRFLISLPRSEEGLDAAKTSHRKTLHCERDCA